MGSSSIAFALFGDQTATIRVYNLQAELPIFHMNGRLVAYRADLEAYLATKAQAARTRSQRLLAEQECAEKV
jgi:hypothetical protein